MPDQFSHIQQRVSTLKRLKEVINFAWTNVNIVPFGKIILITRNKIKGEIPEHCMATDLGPRKKKKEKSNGNYEEINAREKVAERKSHSCS